MKNKQLTVLLILFLSISFNLLSQNSLIVNLKDGSQSGTLLSSLDRITFSNGNAILKLNDATTSSIVLTNINKVTFGFFSGIPDLLPDKNYIAVYPSPATNFIMLKNAPDAEFNIQIIRMDGAVLMNEQHFNSNQHIDISNLANGLYLLRVNNTTLKFMKQ